MNKRYLLVLLLVGLFPAVCAGQEQLLRIGKEIKLNTAIFDAKILASVSSQSFAQLLRSKEILALPEEQQTLLLAQKFAEEKHTLPRTRISIEDKILPREQYTLAQKNETDLGNRVRRLLNDPNTSEEIRRELRQLQYDFSPKHFSVRILDQLNEWIATYDSWPRKKIKKEGPLTFEEQYEVALARHVDYILSGKTSLPAELIEQVKRTRSFYKGDPISEQELIYAVIDNRTQKLIFDGSKIIKNLKKWLEDTHTWPKIIDEEKLAAASLQEKQGHYLAIQVAECRRTYYKEELIDIYNKWFPTPDEWTLATMQTPKKLYQQVQDWLRENGRWPSKSKSYGPESFTEKDIAEIQLARQVESFAKLADPQFRRWKEIVFPMEDFIKLAHHPQFQDRWKEIVISMPSGLTVLRYTGGQYDNPDLEQFRKLYQERHTFAK